MGLTDVALTIKHPTDPKKATKADFLVDSGAAFTVVPYRIVQRLGLTPNFTREFTLADGRKVKRTIGNAIVRFGNEEIATPVVLGEKGDSPLLGALTLEAFGLTLDPFQRIVSRSTLML